MEPQVLERVLASLKENGQLTALGGSIYREAAGVGVNVTDDHLALINEWTRTPLTREQVYTFPALAIDEQATRNYVRYTAASQRASVSRWVGTPFLFNSDSQWASLFDGSDHSLKASSQVGRIYKSDLVRTPEGFIGTLVHVYTAKGVDESVDSFINRIDAGLLREVSIHVMVPGGAKCNICKEMYPCGDHELAQDYNGVTCTVDTVGPFVPLELSSVACPGSVVAHVMPDAETSSYQVLALREALGGSRHLLENQQMHKAEECTNHECTEAVCVEKRTAEHNAETCANEKCDDAKCKEKREASQHNAETCADEKCEDAACKEKRENAPPVGSKEASKHVPLFTEDCPACGRGVESAPKTPATLEEALAPIRTDFQERVTKIVTAAEGKVSAANAERDSFKEKASGYDAMFTEYVNDTVEIAISRGAKQESDRETYTQELAALPLSGVKAVREALKLSEVPESREQRTERLRESASDRARRVFSETSTFTDDNGSQRSYERPRLASQIGPGK